MRPAKFTKFVKDLIDEDREFFQECLLYKGVHLSDAERYAWLDWVRDSIIERYDLQEEIAMEVALEVEKYFNSPKIVLW